MTHAFFSRKPKPNREPYHGNKTVSFLRPKLILRPQEDELVSLSNWFNNINSSNVSPSDDIYNISHSLRTSFETIESIFKLRMMYYSVMTQAYSITFTLIAHMPLIDIQILAVCRMFVP